MSPSSSESETVKAAEHKRPQLKTPVIPDALSPERVLCSESSSCQEREKPQKKVNAHGTCHFLGQQPQSETFTHKHNPNSESTKHPTSGHLYM